MWMWNRINHFVGLINQTNWSCCHQINSCAQQLFRQFIIHLLVGARCGENTFIFLIYISRSLFLITDTRQLICTVNGKCVCVCVFCSPTTMCSQRGQNINVCVHRFYHILSMRDTTTIIYSNLISSLYIHIYGSVGTNHSIASFAFHPN